LKLGIIEVNFNPSDKFDKRQTESIAIMSQRIAPLFEEREGKELFYHRDQE